jgi:uncharacterized protein (DUF305 family)
VVGINLAESDKSTLFAGAAALILIAIVSYGVFGSTNHSPRQDSEFNRADIMFMNMMIIHHDQAIEMAEMSENRTENEKILQISQNISTAQTEENRKMREWLNDAGFNRPKRGHRMAGMATQQEMEELRQSEGQELDILFSELMIEHHQGGIQMARSEVQNGRSDKVVELAEGMITTQQQEIDKMKTWRTEWTDNT